MSNSPLTTQTRVSSPPLPAETRIGHIHLRVANIDRAVHFYRDLLGFDLLMNMGTAAFLSAGGYHHHIGLNTWESKDGHPPAPGSTGLFHFAINYPRRKDLATALARLLDNGWGIDGASDHGTHEAIYLHDPDFNGIEFAWDRAQSEWPKMGDAVAFSRKSLYFKGLLAELGGPERTAQLKELAPYT